MIEQSEPHSSNEDRVATASDLAPYPEWLRESEAVRVRRRRVLAGVEPDAPPIGLALAGGGVRSATFSLGVLQALAKLGLLRRIDYLSTVSGGGYIGGFLGALYQRAAKLPRPRAAETDGASPADLVEAHLWPGAETFPLWWLRENGRYLAPHGAGSAWRVGATLLRNWVAIQVVIHVALVAVLATVDMAHAMMLTPTARHLLARGGLLVDRPVIAGSIWWSPLFAVPVAALVLVAVPSGVAFWLVPVERRANRVSRAAVLTAVAVALPFLGAVLLWKGSGPALVAGAALSSTFLFWAVNRGWRPDEDRSRRHRLSRQLAWGLGAVVVTAGIALTDSFGQTTYAIVQAGGSHAIRSAIGVMLTGGGALAAVVTSGQRLLAMLGASSAKRRRRVRLPVAMVAMLASLAILLPTAVAESALVHAAAWDHRAPAGSPGDVILRGWEAQRPDVSLDGSHIAVSCPPCDAPSGSPTGWMALGPPGLIAALAVALAWALSQFLAFVNQSSLASFYASRLTRAYLGASNEARARDRKLQAATEPVKGDELSIDDYDGSASGGPLHIINVTLNETVSGRSQIDDRERHGLAMAVGPGAVSVGIRHHAERVRSEGDSMVLAAVNRGSPEAFRVFPVPERSLWTRAIARLAARFGRMTGATRDVYRSGRLDLGEWIAVSGAAVATGMGSRTSLGTSLLCGLLNLRLGQWWDSGINPAWRVGYSRRESPFAVALPVLSHLFDEFTAKFRGTSDRHWYLSDGGHFENTACYELVRRELPIIVCCDNGADPDYTFADLGNLVRKVRTDFGADMTFFGPAELDDTLPAPARRYFGALEDLGRRKWRGKKFVGGAQPHAALARIAYASGSTGILVLVKPTLCGEEPHDVRQYQVAHPAFPQESTADQFFDEAQWESYRRLGEHIAGCLGAVFTP